jgi:hypothetical protein
MLSDARSTLALALDPAETSETRSMGQPQRASQAQDAAPRLGPKS